MKHSSILTLTLVLMAGCSSSTTSSVSQQKPSKAFTVANTQLAPEPVYNRLRWVQLPEVLPTTKSASPTRAKSQEALKKPMMFPVINFELKDGTLQEASQMLAASSQYKAFCDPSFAANPISVTMLGTIHEIANKISEVSGVDVLIDHTNREVRFVPRSLAVDGVL